MDIETYKDLHHKMNKKVAQLTKVIFYLNTKNDEYEANISNIVFYYEKEMDNIGTLYNFASLLNDAFI